MHEICIFFIFISFLRRLYNKSIYCLFFLFIFVSTSAFAQSQSHTLYGGIEIGAKGVKPIVIKFNAMNEDEEKYDFVPRDTINTTLIQGVQRTNNFSQQAILETVEVVNKLYQEMQKIDKVPSENIYIVGSSALQKADNKNVLSQEILKATKKSMSFLDSKEEVFLSISNLLPKKYSNSSILIDIGSGNTKGGYQISRSTVDTIYDYDNFVTFSIPYGTVTLTDKLFKNTQLNNIEFTNEANRLLKKGIVLPLKEQIDRKPGLLNRSRVYLSGGIVWAIATLTHPENRKPVVKITSQDINAFLKKVKRDPAFLSKPTFAKLKPYSQHSMAFEQDFQKIKDTFTPRNLVAGTIILQTLSKELQFQNKKLYFSRQGNIAWLLSFVNQKISESNKNPPKRVPNK
jgi:hypothetical protein